MTPFFVLPVEGSDLILGMAWLRTLDPILVDYTVPQITFSRASKSITLKGEPISSSVSKPRLQTILHNTDVASLHAIYFTFESDQPTGQPTHTTHPYPIIAQLLQTYNSIFDKPKSLPLDRSQNHNIPTVPIASSVNVKPYRYPHYQKR